MVQPVHFLINFILNFSNNQLFDDKGVKKCSKIQHILKNKLYFKFGFLQAFVFRAAKPKHRADIE